MPGRGAGRGPAGRGLPGGLRAAPCPFKTPEAQDPLHLVAFQDPRDQCETTNLREPPRLLLLQTKAEAGICSVFKSSSSTEVRVGLAGGAGKQQAGVGHKPPLR